MIARSGAKAKGDRSMAESGAVHHGTWTFEEVHDRRAEYELPGGRGVTEHIPFGNGLILFRSEMQVDETCVIDTQWDTSLPMLFTQTHLMGTSILETPDGRSHRIAPDRAMVMRITRPGARFIIPGGQTLRHVGVSADLPALEAQFANSLPSALAPFVEPPSTGVLVRSCCIGQRMRGLLTRLFTPRADGAAAPLVREGIAALILAELIEYLAAENDAGDDPNCAAWERLAVQEVADYVAANLHKPLGPDHLAKRAGLTRARLQTLFRRLQDCSLAEYIRVQRLTAARRFLEAGLPLKQVAEDVGYSHVSNFSTAYRAYFGETPGRTLRRTLED